MTTQITTYTLPVLWAAYLINGDNSNLSNDEEAIIINWLKDSQIGKCTEMSEETDFRQFMGLGCEVAEFTFIK